MGLYSFVNSLKEDFMNVIHTDASTKNGYSCWAYKSSNEGEKYHAGVVKMSNSAAAENIAAIKAIQSFKDSDEKLLIVSDSLVTVRLIQERKIRRYKNKGQFKQTCNELTRLLKGRDIEALWINSKNTNKTHIEVDGLAKSVLNTYLQYHEESTLQKADKNIETGQLKGVKTLSEWLPEFRIYVRDI